MTPIRNLRRADEVSRPRSFLGPWLLLLLAEQPSHGYVLRDRLRLVGYDWAGGPGPIYHELRLLAEAGLVKGTAALVESGPVALVYELTPTGRAHLGRLAAAFGELEETAHDYRSRVANVERSASRPGAQTAVP